MKVINVRKNGCTKDKSTQREIYRKLLINMERKRKNIHQEN